MSNRAAQWSVGVGIAAIVLAMVAGPVLAPPEFSWIEHSTSEQAAQHSPGAWIMQIGFVAYGLGVLIAAVLDWKTRPYVRAALAVFGVGLVATAVWSNAPIVPGAPADLFEDGLHSLASGVIGAAFAFACGARLFAPGGSRRDWLAWLGVAAAVAIPQAMGLWPDYAGLTQRTMFAISFVFTWREFRSGR